MDPQDPRTGVGAAAPTPSPQPPAPTLSLTGGIFHQLPLQWASAREAWAGESASLRGRTHTGTGSEGSGPKAPLRDPLKARTQASTQCPQPGAHMAHDEHHPQAPQPRRERPLHQQGSNAPDGAEMGAREPRDRWGGSEHPPWKPMGSVFPGWTPPTPFPPVQLRLSALAPWMRTAGGRGQAHGPAEQHAAHRGGETQRRGSCDNRRTLRR